MDDKEFYDLHNELEGIYLKLHYLQDLYRKETGRSFVFGQSFTPRSAQPEDSADTIGKSQKKSGWMGDMGGPGCDPVDYP